MDELTTAGLYEQAFRSLAKGAERNTWGQFASPNFYSLVQKIRKAALTLEEECPESFDSSEIVTFRDGSRLRLDNPSQTAFTLDIREIE